MQPAEGCRALHPKGKRLWLPVSSYLIECPRGRVLVDAGWGRSMNPQGAFDKKAQVKSPGSRRILASRDEIESVKRGIVARIRYQGIWWEGTGIEFFDWNGTEGSFGKSYDLFGDGSVVCVAIPGHADGLFAVKTTGEGGRFVLLFSDGGYASRSWQEMILSGIANDRAAQKRSLEWIREQSLDPLCVGSLANHDPDVEPHTVVV